MYQVHREYHSEDLLRELRAFYSRGHLTDVLLKVMAADDKDRDRMAAASSPKVFHAHRALLASASPAMSRLLDESQASIRQQAIHTHTASGPNSEIRIAVTFLTGPRRRFLIRSHGGYPDELYTHLIRISGIVEADLENFLSFAYNGRMAAPRPQIAATLRLALALEVRGLESGSVPPDLIHDRSPVSSSSVGIDQIMALVSHEYGRDSRGHAEHADRGRRDEDDLGEKPLEATREEEAGVLGKYHCRLCGHSFLYKSTYLRHLSAMHDPNAVRYACRSCPFTSLHKRSLLRHLAKRICSC